MLISIITVCFNNLEGLKSTVASVKNQDYKDLEHIIVDGNSIDGTKDYLQTLNSSKITWISEPDHGIYSAMNKGCKRARGEYLIFLNSGDIFYDSKALINLASAADNKHSYDLIYGNIQVLGSQEPWIKTYPEKLNFDYFVKDTLPHPATLIHSSCFDKLSYDEDLKIVSDWKFFMLGVLKRKFNYIKVNSVISNFFDDGLSSISPQIVANERNLVLNEKFKWHLWIWQRKRKLRQLVSICLKKLSIKIC